MAMVDRYDPALACAGRMIIQGHDSVLVRAWNAHTVTMLVTTEHAFRADAEDKARLSGAFLGAGIGFGLSLILLTTGPVSWPLVFSGGLSGAGALLGRNCRGLETDSTYRTHQLATARLKHVQTLITAIEQSQEHEALVNVLGLLRRVETDLTQSVSTTHEILERCRMEDTGPTDGADPFG